MEQVWAPDSGREWGLHLQEEGEEGFVSVGRFGYLVSGILGSFYFKTWIFSGERKGGLLLMRTGEWEGSMRRGQGLKSSPW